MTRSRDYLPASFAATGRMVAIAGLAVLGGACSLPVTVPLGPMAAISDPVETTGSIPEATENTGETLDDDGIAARIGSNAWASLRNVLISAAERGEDGQAFSWKSDNAGVEGTVTAVNAFFDEDGAVCRRLAVTAIAYERTDSFATEACQKDSGVWNVGRPGDDT